MAGYACIVQYYAELVFVSRVYYNHSVVESSREYVGSLFADGDDASRNRNCVRIAFGAVARKGNLGRRLFVVAYFHVVVRKHAVRDLSLGFLFCAARQQKYAQEAYRYANGYLYKFLFHIIHLLLLKPLQVSACSLLYDIYLQIAVSAPELVYQVLFFVGVAQSYVVCQLEQTSHVGRFNSYKLAF